MDKHKSKEGDNMLTANKQQYEVNKEHKEYKPAEMADVMRIVKKNNKKHKTMMKLLAK